MPLSPEETGIYRCNRCGNQTQFIGIDAHGSPGDVCDAEGCTHDGADRETCENWQDCELEQPFTVVSQDGTHQGANLDYQAHTGGGDGAEIGSYTRIDCARCGAVVWDEKTASAVTEITPCSKPFLGWCWHVRDANGAPLGPMEGVFDSAEEAIADAQATYPEITQIKVVDGAERAE